MNMRNNNIYYLIVAAVIGLVAIFWIKIPAGERVATPTPIPTAPENLLGRPLLIKAGKTVAVDSGKLAITFANVLQDNRCPIDIRCLVIGQATIQIKASQNGRDLGSVNLISGPDKTLASRKIGGYAITLIKVDPQPVSTKKLEFKDYTITVVVTK
ncbi:MAG: hypothetical protein A2750_03125 [Candidatus Yanofskybacteria bacterium RIFCSPHIGHO2_01_FULL_45_42]|uniref:Uncharacterized protein n=3 Tax=Candidatus Yanofskyibacteriota TaxID=1752733 RepID=A0A1F8F2C6_9BACT|nr:MAG: hypothetical protein A2750_03125 [Candidatus Yanofskybacteria bacterium RIFCSPHIGHO2_01_FULL_45_42]OGN16448.1 MAG: hypothetical protein A3C81_00575 [Candidatus Yanofskybacteria bacterium RIFCSPHIGHO2_02_FULL_46_19]OGN27363.1 MAG: hypothetical protein A3B17_00155 [Candidatus Yanofskybacteria bacterium RIFCSPLOWO2_01_FULL_45_72]OGN31684.1 MAG: hypothetical protein A3J01_02180 [Candidatus Yanofskybacteria bacterium RIFCSPLOWO2_02_FULL_45_18]